MEDFSIRRIDGYMSSCYLVKDQDGFLLVDSGSSCDLELIEKNLIETGSSPAEIKLCVLTHMHPDHAGAAGALRKKYGVPIAASPVFSRWYSGPTGLIQYRIDIHVAGLTAKRKTGRPELIDFDRHLKPDLTIEDNSYLPGFPDFRVICVPGHTSSDIAIYHEKSRALFAGDLFCEVKDRIVPPLPVNFRGTMKNSYRKLSALDMETIYPAHGNPVRGEACSNIFPHLAECLNDPPKKLEKKARRFGSFSPEVQRIRLEHVLAKVRNTKAPAEEIYYAP